MKPESLKYQECELSMSNNHHHKEQKFYLFSELIYSYFNASTGLALAALQAMELTVMRAINPDTKEIARMLNISPAASQKSRHGLWKKRITPR